MRRIVLSLWVLVAATLPAVAGTAGVAAGGATTAGARSYLVLYRDTAAGRQAVARAGGTVVSENHAIGLAEVSSTNDRFLDDVRADAGVRAAARDRSFATARPGMGHKFKDERLDGERAARRGEVAPVPTPAEDTLGDLDEPLAGLQWDMQMIHATPEGSYAVEPGDRRVLVGVIDTGIDASHPDIAPNLDVARSRNFTTDLPAIDGPCEYDGCVDPPTVDDDGHGTHVAGTIAAPVNDFGMAGVAPGVTLVNIRAGQDSGYFFVKEFADALTYAADSGIDVVNMSFYVDPWLYNCPSADGYVKADKGHPTPDELAEQQAILEMVQAATAYAHDGNVTMIAAAGNDNTDLSAPTRVDATSPDFFVDGNGAVVDAAYTRTVTKDCLDLPNEAPDVISVSAIGPSGQKADYSNWGIDEIDVAAPGGWYRDFDGTARHRVPENMILGPYPEAVGRALGDIDAGGNPTNPFVVKYCGTSGTCAYYQWIQGTSMASPHAVGVAALIVSRYGTDDGAGGLTMDPDVVRAILKGSAIDTECVPYNYAKVGRHPASAYRLKCEGSAQYNNVYGDGIVDALAAVGGMP